MPKLHEGEEIVKIVSGTYHYTALTSEGRVFSWGSNTLGQCKVPDDAQGASDIFAARSRATRSIPTTSSWASGA